MPSLALLPKQIICNFTWTTQERAKTESCYIYLDLFISLGKDKQRDHYQSTWVEITIKITKKKF